MLQGKAWGLVEDLDITSLGEADGYDKMFARLDSGFKYDPMTELPYDFENFFVKLQRRPEQTLQEYSADFARAHRKLRSTQGGGAGEGAGLVVHQEERRHAGTTSDGAHNHGHREARRPCSLSSARTPSQRMWEDGSSQEGDLLRW